MKIQENVLLAPYTTFKIGGPARWFCVVKDQFDGLEAYEFAKKNNLQTFILGGGSNLLISDKGFNGVVIKIENRGVEIVSEDSDRIMLKVASGENWDEFVQFCVNNKWWGVENLSHIPGSTGAIAVQNVGAYGQEAKNVIDSVTVFNIETHQILNLKNSDCGFGYRTSIFNTTSKGKFIIFNIIFCLTKNNNPVISYKDLSAKFSGNIPTIQEIRSAVIEIRDKKFPFPVAAQNGSAGSFFKNPILTAAVYRDLLNTIKLNFDSEKAEALEKKKFEEDGKIKIPAAFLIELCNLKNLAIGGAAINKNQPLVILNKSGEATASDVLDLANEVKHQVLKKTSVELNFEPELIGF
jgi:UDP-N-acetylmuramate dehydrogenase